MRLERTPEIKVKDWVQTVTTVSDITQRSRMVTFLLWAYGFLLAGTMALFFLQGFRTGGFHLEEATMHWLGAATIGEIGGLLTRTFGYFFKRR
jgi:hypothetical protein